MNEKLNKRFDEIATRCEELIRKQKPINEEMMVNVRNKNFEKAIELAKESDKLEKEIKELKREMRLILRCELTGIRNGLDRVENTLKILE